MTKNSTYYNNLISKYFDGEISVEEFGDLSAWIKADVKNEEIFSQSAHAWQILSKYKTQQIDLNSDWDRLNAKLFGQETANNDTKPIIALAEQRHSNIFMQKIVRYAAAVLLVLGLSWMGYYYFSKPEIIQVTASLNNLEITLPDGSQLTLYQGSSISYPEKFAPSERQVILTGEGYFNVTHHAEQPFVVSTGDARIKVLGTQFNVNTSEAGNRIEVVLTTGKVAVYRQQTPDTKVMLEPGEKAIISADFQPISKMKNTDENYMAWKTREIVFVNEKLSQVAKTLEHVYKTKIRISDAQAGDYRFTASFSGQTLPSVLKVVKETLDLKVEPLGSGYEIKAK
jgi:ferric-dicitrate binding protein FerR (iron transport regulator)